MTAALIALAFAVLFPSGFSTFGTAPLRMLAAAAALSGATAAIALVVRRALVAVDEVKIAAILPTVLNLPRAIALIVVGLAFPSLTNVLWVVIIASALAMAAWIGVAISRGYLSARFTFANAAQALPVRRAAGLRRVAPVVGVSNGPLSRDVVARCRDLRRVLLRQDEGAVPPHRVPRTGRCDLTPLLGARVEGQVSRDGRSFPP